MDVHLCPAHPKLLANYCGLASNTLGYFCFQCEEKQRNIKEDAQDVTLAEDFSCDLEQKLGKMLNG